MKFKRQENETERHFIWRVYKYLEDTNKITVEQAGEICNRELKLDYDESRHRKIYQSFSSMWKEVQHEYVKEDSLIERLDEIDNREDELYKTKVKTSDKLREYRKNLRDEARIENLKEVAIDAANIISNNHKLINNKNYVVLKDDKVAVVQLSDWHFANVIHNYWNDYDIDEFYKRISQFSAEVIENCKSNNVKNIKVLNQGDLVNGIIHVSTRVANEEDIISQTQHVSEAVAQLLTSWAEYFDTIDYYSVLDNHSRVTPNKKEHIEKENFNRFVDWFLEARLKNVKNIRIHKNDIDQNIGVIDIFNEKAFFVHGHLDRPTNIVQNLTLMTRIFPIAVFMGHLHHNIEDEIHGVDLIMSPSLSGTDDYSVSVRATGLARQKMTIYKNDKKVKRLCTYFIEF